MRAQNQLDWLTQDMKWWKEGGPYQAVTHFDKETQLNHIVVEHVDVLPLKWTAVIGEILYNLRSSLDHLAWDLATSHSGKEVPKTEFPIFKDRCAFAQWNFKRREPARSSGLFKVRGITPTAQTFIERLQPYNRGDEATSDPLWLLHDLNNIDKHRTLHLVAAVVRDSWLQIRMTRITFSETAAISPLEPGAEIAVIPGNLDDFFIHDSEPIDFDVDVRLHFTIDVAFAQGSPVTGLLVLPLLDQLRDATKVTLETVSKFLPGMVGPDEMRVARE